LLTGKMDEAKVGDEVLITGPLGEFVFKEEENKENDLVFLAGGTGIVPFRCLIKYITDKKLKNRMVLLFSARTKEHIIYKDLPNIKNESFKYVITLTRQEWDGPMGRINEDLIKKSVEGLKNPVFYVCGPQILVEELTEKIKKLGYDRIKVDRWR
ncbi:hypothetical protein KY308_01385, partial [Candidatus Woesearchaeota archaeon]|nr:hypothetical protein [Candidatus Woesearchaeota archaeon]